MPAIIKPRRKDCKYYVEEGMRKLGYKVSSNITNNLDNKECYVIYSRIGMGLDSQESYRTYAYIKIVINILDNNDIPNEIDKIHNAITKYVEESGAPQCVSFYFGDVNIDTLGTTSNVTLDAQYNYEVDWIHEI